MNEVIKFGNTGFYTDGVGSFTFEVASTQQLASVGILPFYNSIRPYIPIQIAGFKVIPAGEQNRLPDEMREILDEGNGLEELMRKRANLLWGQGPALYQFEFKDGDRKRVWVEEPAVEAWLKSWDYEDYLMKANTDFQPMQGHFTRLYRNRGPRLGGDGKIVKLEHVTGRKCRLEWPEDGEHILGIITGNYDRPFQYGLTRYPVFDKANPFANPVSMSYSNLYGYAMDWGYSRPSFNGSLNMLRLGIQSAKILYNFNLNSTSIKFHVTSPAAFWDDLEERLKKKCESKGIEFTDKVMQDAEKEIFKKFTDTLGGIDNVGKFLHTRNVYDVSSGTFVGWKIETIDQKIKDFIDAQINVLKMATFEASSGVGLHPALSNISRDGNLPSGSEQLYAFKLYLMTQNDIAERIVCRDINNAIQVNFPGTKVRIGFYHDAVITESQTSPKDRVKNNTPG